MIVKQITFGQHTFFGPYENAQEIEPKPGLFVFMRTGSECELDIFALNETDDLKHAAELIFPDTEGSHIDFQMAIYYSDSKNERQRVKTAVESALGLDCKRLKQV
jgi:hypothetical protein